MKNITYSNNSRFLAPGHEHTPGLDWNLTVMAVADAAEDANTAFPTKQCSLSPVVSDIVASLAVPLTEAIRPKNFSQYIGQDHLLNPQHGEIANFLRLGYLPSMVLSGPPGVGKTSLARLLAHEANYVFVELSATSATVAELKELLDQIAAENHKRERRHSPRLRVLVFIDEIHRFSSVQQDYLLPFLEAGTFVFVGATTADPAKSVRRAVLSRCQLFKLHALSPNHLSRVAWRAILYENVRRRVGLKSRFLLYSETAVAAVVAHANGDMRSAVNLVELIGSKLSSKECLASDSNDMLVVDETIVSEAIKHVSKARFGLQSLENLPLLAHLLYSLRHPASRMKPEIENDKETENANENANENEIDRHVDYGIDNLISRGTETQENNGNSPSSDAESWVDEKLFPNYEYVDPKWQDWANHIPLSDDEQASPGPIYSDDENEPIGGGEMPSFSSFSASKFRILSAIVACLQLLKRGESPLSILKYLVLFTCTHSVPEKGELIIALSAYKALAKSGVGAEKLLFNCIERLAGTRHYEPSLLRHLLEAAKLHCVDNIAENIEEEEKESGVKFEITFDDDLASKLLQDIPHQVNDEEVLLMETIISPLDQLDDSFTLGEGDTPEEAAELATLTS